MLCQVVLFSTAPWAPRLAGALRTVGASVAMPPAAGARIVAAVSFAEADLSASGCAAEDAALTAAEVPPHCYFSELLLARARRRWRNPVALPALRGGRDFAAAAEKIAAALSALPAPQTAAPAATENGAPLTQIAEAAAAARAGDIARARRLAPAADIPAARALSLLLDAQTGEDLAARARAAERLRREIFNLTEEEKNAIGAPAFLAAFAARRALDGIL